MNSIKMIKVPLWSKKEEDGVEEKGDVQREKRLKRRRRRKRDLFLQKEGEKGSQVRSYFMLEF